MSTPRSDLHFRGAGGLTLAATRYGTEGRPTVLFLHGAGQTRHSWFNTAAAVAQLGFECLCIDHRGHGDSQWPRDADYAMDDYADDLDELLEQVSQPPVVVGASLGGVATLVVQSRHSRQRYRAVVLVDIAPRVDLVGARRVLEFMGAHPQGFATLEEASTVIAGYTGRPRPQHVQGLTRVLRVDPDTGWWKWHWDPRFLSNRLEEDERLPERVNELQTILLAGARNLRVPTLLVRGARSDVVSAAAVDELRAAVPHAQTFDVSGAGHMVAGDNNTAFTDAVCTFLVALP